MNNAAILTFVGLLFLAGIVCLQIFLSKRENKWFGIILPAISMGYSLLMILSFAAYESAWHTIIAVLVIFLMGNIPTAVLLVIYFACREKYKKQAQLKKMNVQDL